VTYRRDFIAGFAALGATALLPVAAQTGEAAWPTKPVRVIVPFTPGGSTDVAARVVSAHLGETLGQPFVIDNRPGAGGNIGLEALSRAEPDGYTIGICTTAHAINTTLFKRPGYDLRRGFAPIGLLQEGPLVLVAHPSLPVKSISELIAYAKAHPGTLNYASSGTGNSTHMAGELFDIMAGVKTTHVPYKGSAPSIADTIGGVCQMSFDTMISALPHIQAGKLKPLAVTSATRSPLLPQVPTIAESGLPGYEVTAWNGMTAPANTPAHIITKLQNGVLQALGTAKIKTRFDLLGVSIRPMSSVHFRSFLMEEINKWEKAVTAARITLD
jgi:tripartite-type tricarboxylate transporter receptor subunit TctC